MEELEIQKTPKAFTRTGDRGSSLIGFDSDNTPIRIEKDNLQMVIWGCIDELSCWLGCIDNREYENIQSVLYKISGYLYNKNIDQDLLKKTIDKMERFCKKHEDSLTTEFILPKGKIHYARALTRKVERYMVTYAKTSSLDGVWLLVKYFNRLSSYFYVEAERKFNLDDEEEKNDNIEKEYK